MTFSGVTCSEENGVKTFLYLAWQAGGQSAQLSGSHFKIVLGLAFHRGSSPPCLSLQSAVTAILAGHTQTVLFSSSTFSSKSHPRWRPKNPPPGLPLASPHWLKGKCRPHRPLGDFSAKTGRSQLCNAAAGGSLNLPLG